jgi:hypothetical protein
MTATLVFYVDSMPYEAAAAALFKLGSHTECVALTISEARDRAVVEKHIDAHNFEASLYHVVFYGTYWRDENLEYYAEKLSRFNVDITVYDYGAPVPEAKQHEDIQRFYGEPDKTGLASFTLKFLRDHKMLTSTTLEMLTNFSASAIALIDDRTFNRNMNETQLLFSGMYNIGSQDTKLIDKFVDLFKGTLNFDGVMKLGKTVAEVQTNMALARALNNSRKIKLADGTEACITNAPDLVNLTNDMLHKVHQTPVTVTTALNFKGDTTISFSVRSYEKGIDAGALARLIKDENGKQSGDGNAAAGGGRRKIAIEMPF